MNTIDFPLPTIEQERLDDIERQVLGRIAAERSATRRRARTARRSGWVAAGAAAAVIVVAAAVGPSLSGLSSGSGASESAADGALEPGRGWVADDLGGADAESGSDSAADEAAAGAEQSAPTREVIATASVSLETTDAAAAAEEVGALAAEVGGYVETLSLQRVGQSDARSTAEDTSYREQGGAWISVRVPAAELTGVIEDLADIGEVRSSEIQRDDVTSRAVDLRARVAALEGSVARLLDLIADADSTADLITAEDALAERQAELDSLRGQLTLLDDRVALSSLTVSLEEPAPAVAADPTGFGDGLATGWNTLVASVNGIVIGLGFLLPWIGAAGIGSLVVWLIVRAVRRRRPDSQTPPVAE